MMLSGIFSVVGSGHCVTENAKIGNKIVQMSLLSAHVGQAGGEKTLFSRQVILYVSSSYESSRLL